MSYIAVLDNGTIQLSGKWTLEDGPDILPIVESLSIPENDVIAIDGELLETLDSSGAMVLCHLLTAITKQDKKSKIINFDKKFENLLKFTFHHEQRISERVEQVIKRNFLYIIGKKSSNIAKEAWLYTGFIGEVANIFAQVLTFKKRWHYRNTLHSIEDVGYNAIPIISLLMFLVGVVLAYQLGVQLESYGANIFIVNLTGLAVLREFGPLIAAIIVAGRSASAITAEISLMKVNEEIDALAVMGMSPINRVAVPKIIAVLICMPLLTIVSDAFGVFGSMVMSEARFGIHIQDFIQRFDDVTQVSSLWTGLFKSPFFGLIIGSVGCYQGFHVKYSAESIGRQTTKSVVQAIFLVIIADALFSVLFSIAGI